MSTLVQNKENIIYGEMVNMVIIHCCNCSIPFAAPVRWNDRRIEDHKTFYCPNGHPQSYTEHALTQKERELREKLKEAERQLQATKNSESYFIKQWEKKLDENKILTRQIKRVHKGVCPCCNRTFQNLANHIKTKHPELKK